MRAKSKNIIAVIPARYNSQRFPGKVLYPVLGKPLIQRVYENVCQSSGFTRVVVATEDERVLQVVLEFGGEAIMTSDTHVSGTDRIWEVVEKMDVDIVVNIQGDEPLLHAKTFEELVSPFLGDQEVCMSTLAYKNRKKEYFNDPNTVKVVMDSHGYALYFSRAGIPYDRDGVSDGTWLKHIGVYAYTKDFLQWIASSEPGKLEQIEKLEQLRVLENGFSIKVVETDYDSLGIDTPEDVEKVEKMLKQV